MSKIKVVFLISNLPQGGAEKQFVNLIKHLNKELFDIDVYLYAYQKDAFFDEIFNFNGVNVFKNKLYFSNHFFKIPEALFFIRKTLSNKNYDIVYTSLFMNSFFTRLIAPSFYKNKIITSVRNSRKLYSNLHLSVEKYFIKNSHIVFNSKIAFEDFKSIFNLKLHNRLHVIYNGYSFDTNIKTKTDYDLVNITIGALGRQTKQKNFTQLARVFKKTKANLNNEKINLSLIIQGNHGDETVDVISILGDQFSKQVLKNSNSNIDLFFNNVNIKVLPSFYEGCPNVLFEAMIRKTICVVSNGANSDNFVIDGQSGFVYDGSDAGLLQSLKSAIAIIGSEKEDQIVENAYKYATKNFSMEVMVNKYEKLFKEVYEKNKSSN